MRTLLIFLILAFVSIARANLIEVSSELWDLGKDSEVRVSGVGSLVWADNRCFVLTAGHVSLGENLFLEGEDGTGFVPVRRWDDAVHDVALIEVERPTERVFKKYILAAYLPHQDVRGRALVTNLAVNYGESHEMINPHTLQEYHAQEIDVKGRFALPGRDSRQPTVVYPTQVLIASWLPYLSSKQIEDLTYPRWEKLKSLPRGADVSTYDLHLPFAKGYSGSPLIQHHGFFVNALSSLYTVAGVLTLSNKEPNVAESHAAGPAVLHGLIERAIAGTPPSEELPHWFFLNGYFGRLKTDLVIFFTEGPVGNGIAPIGKTPEPLAASPARGELDKKLLGLKTRDVSLESVKAGLKSLGLVLHQTEQANQSTALESALKEVERVLLPTSLK